MLFQGRDEAVAVAHKRAIHQNISVLDYPPVYQLFYYSRQVKRKSVLVGNDSVTRGTSRAIPGKEYCVPTSPSVITRSEAIAPQARQSRRPPCKRSLRPCALAMTVWGEPLSPHLTECLRWSKFDRLAPRSSGCGCRTGSLVLRFINSETNCLPLPSRTGSATVVPIDPDYLNMGRLRCFHTDYQPSNADERMQCAPASGVAPPNRGVMVELRATFTAHWETMGQAVDSGAATGGDRPVFP
jgi:hypothetical protein